MALDSAAADAVALAIKVALLAQPPASDPTGINSLKIIVEQIYAGIIAHAVVVPLNVNGEIPTPMNVTGNPVTGVGGIT